MWYEFIGYFTVTSTSPCRAGIIGFKKSYLHKDRCLWDTTIHAVSPGSWTRHCHSGNDWINLVLSSGLKLKYSAHCFNKYEIFNNVYELTSLMHSVFIRYSFIVKNVKNIKSSFKCKFSLLKHFYKHLIFISHFSIICQFRSEVPRR